MVKQQLQRGTSERERERKGESSKAGSSSSRCASYHLLALRFVRFAATGSLLAIVGRARFNSIQFNSIVSCANARVPVYLSLSASLGAQITSSKSEMETEAELLRGNGALLAKLPRRSPREWRRSWRAQGQPVGGRWAPVAIIRARRQAVEQLSRRAVKQPAQRLINRSEANWIGASWKIGYQLASARSLVLVQVSSPSELRGREAR